MRLFEIATPLSIGATKRCLKSLGFYLRGYPELEKTFRDFCRAKLQGRIFGRKDMPFTGGPLKGNMHAHLVHGKVIIIYTVRNGVLQLFDVGEHDSYEGSGTEALGTYIRSLGPADFTSVELDPPKRALTAEQKNDLRDLFFEMVASDPGVVETAIAGDMTDLMYFAGATVEEDDEAIYAAYGGKDGLRQFLSKIMRQMAA